MKKVWMVGILSLALLLSACGPETEVTESETQIETTEQITEAPTETKFQPAPITVPTESHEEHSTELSDLPIDPPYDFDFATMVPKDFGALFEKTYPSTVSTYKLLPGTAYENEVTVIQGAEAGPVVYVVAGVHGDEEAAWQTGKLLKKISIKAGTLYILAPANRWGAEAKPKTRTAFSGDINRSFPGKADGKAAEQIANSIFRDIADKKPEFVFDLHEARVIEEGRDFLGSSLVYSDLDLFGDLFLDIILATESGEICSGAFNYYAPGPAGSINNTVTNQLKIPTMTIETFRGYEMKVRVADQLDIIQYVLRAKHMVE